MLDQRPIGGGTSGSTVQGMDLGWYVFDLTLAHATDVWVNEIINALCPKGKKWLNFVAGTDIPDEKVEEVNKKLQDRTKLFFDFLKRSNFQTIVHECFSDAAVSTGFMTINEGPDEKNPWIFVSNPVDCIYADEGPYGTFDAYYRDWIKLPITHAKVMWPKFKVPPEVEKITEEDPHLDVYEMLHHNYETKKWDYNVVHAGSQHLCYSRVDRTSAFIGWRVKKLSGEVYGRGPALDAAPAAGTINQALYDEIVSANFQALPMYMGFEDGVFNPNNVVLRPNTILACSPTASGSWPLQPIPQAGNIQWSMLILNELRQQINNIMHTNPLPAMDDPKATATEILKRDQRNIENRAAQDSRIQNEFFAPMVARCIDILRKKGLWDDIEVDGEIIDVQFDTPLVTSEGQRDVLEMMQHIQFVQSLFGGEAASGFYNIDKMSPWAAEKLGVDLEVVRTSDEIAEQMQQVQEQKQQMQEQQMQQQQAEGAQQ